MIPNHPRFLEVLKDKKKVSVKFYSKADNGVLERICAPIRYGPGNENQDELNRYWVWDYATTTGTHVLGLVPQQIVDLQVLGECFEPIPSMNEAAPLPVPVLEALPAAPVAASGNLTIPIL